MGSKGSNTTTQQSTYAPNPEAMAAYQGVLQRAQGVANTPYTPYGGELVAGVNNQQNMGIGNVNANANWAQPYIQGAIGQAGASSAPLSQAAIQSYMNPYTQNVIDATQNQFNHQNAIDLQNSRGNSIANGALGGNRQAVKESLLAEGQMRQQAPVIAGLYNQGYGQAVNTAQGQQQIGLQGAGMMGNLGVAGQGTGLQGAQAQIGAGTLQQGTQQALDQAQLAQFQQAQAFPYQQAQWLAGITGGMGSQMGGTTYGQTTGPAPNPWSTALGGITSGVGMLGATGAFGSAGWMAPLMLSDERAKENIHEIGKLHDGQKIYRFNYKGDNKTQVGLLGQEVERHKPEAVHKANGVHMVDYDTATEDAVKERAFGGGIGLAAGGVPGMPFGNAPTWIPEVNLPHGNTRPGAAPSAPQQPQNDLSKQAASMGDLAKTLRTAMGSDTGNNGVALPWGGQVPNAVGSTSVGGASGPAPLFGAGGMDSNGLTVGDYSNGNYARGGGVGYADGGAPSFDDRFNAVYGQDVVNPDSPFRMPDQTAVNEWRQGVDRDIGRTPEEVPEKAIEARGVVPTSSQPSKAMAFAGTPSSDDDLPSEVTQGYSAGPRRKSAGVAAEPEQQGGQPQSSSPNVDWGADSKLWPSLISAGFGMMASRSPFLGQAIGEGGQAGVGSYNLQQQREFEARKFAEQQKLQREKFEAEKEQAERPYEEMTAAEKERVAYQKRQEQRLNMEPVDIGYDALGRAIKALRQPDGSFRVIDPQTGRALGPGESLGGFGPSSSNPLKTTPSSGNAPVGAAKPYTVSDTTPAVLQDPKLPTYMRVNNEPSPRDEAVIEQLESMPGGKMMATTVKGLVDYTIDPAKLANNKGGRDMAIAYAKMYDPSWDQTLYSAKQKAVNEFFAGGPQSPAGTMTAGNTAILHLSQMYDTVENMEKTVGKGGYVEKGADWIGKQGIPWISYQANQARNKGAQGTGSEFAVDLNKWQVAKTRFTDEVTKFYAGSGGSEGERERALAVLDEAKSWPELKEAIREDLRLMRSKVEQMQGRLSTGLNPGLWRDVAKRDPELILLYKNSREASDKILGAGGGHGAPKQESTKTTEPAPSGKPTLQEFLSKAQQANPKASVESLTEYYNKKYGGQ